jgi:hypothetical protein
MIPTFFVRREWGMIEGGEESRKNTPPFAILVTNNHHINFIIINLKITTYIIKSVF